MARAAIADSEVDQPRAYMGLVESLCTLVERRGFEREQILRGSGLSGEQIANPLHRVHFAVLRDIMQRGMDLVNDPAMGLEFGLLSSIRSYGFWGYAALASATLRDATVGVYERYHRAFAPMDIKVRTEGSTVVVESDSPPSLGDLLPMMSDAGVVSFHRVLEFLVGGPLANVEVRLPYPEQSHHQVLRSIVRAPVHFDCASNQFRFDLSEFDRPIQSADPALASLAAAQCEEELRRVQGDSSLLVQVRSRVRAAAADGAPIERVASELRMGARTLRRRLDALGTSYAEVVDSTRRGLAIELLVTSDQSVDEVATRLGYSNVSNLRRAFRRWTGASPAAYRAKHRTPAG